MARFFALTSSSRDERPAEVGPGQAAELRRIANLYVISGTTLLLFLARVFASALHVTFVPHSGYVVWGVVLLAGWAVSYVYGIWVTLAVRRWGWLVLCAIPVTCVPAAVAYAWMRRLEIEREVLGDSPRSPSRQRRGGRASRH